MSALAMDNTTSHSPSFELPKVPVPHGEFIAHLKTQLKTPIADVVAPYNSFEKKLREGYAQYPQSQAVQDPYVNAIPLFQGQEDNIRIRARALDDEVETQKYVMPLKSEDRKSDGALAIVGSLPGFKKNFNLFSESSLVDLDWNNVVAAGSSVVTALLPVPTKYNTSKKALRYGLLIWFNKMKNANSLQRILSPEASSFQRHRSFYLGLG